MIINEDMVVILNLTDIFTLDSMKYEISLSQVF